MRNWQRKYRKTEKFKKYNREYYQKLKERGYIKEYCSRHEVKERRRIYDAKPEHKERRRLYAMTPKSKLIKYRWVHSFAGRAYRKAQKLNRGMAFQTIQLVYESNIKKFGRLTCYLCLIPIDFGNNHLEHKMPLSRGGTNAFENLDVACANCNRKKHTKTVEEFLKCA